MSTPATRCQSFHTLFGGFDAAFTATAKTFEDYIATNKGDVPAAISAIEKHHDEFLEKFRQSVVEVMREWYGANPHFNPDAFEVEKDSGRVVLNDNLNMNFTVAQCSFQHAVIPSVIRKITKNVTVRDVPDLSAIDFLEEIGGYVDIFAKDAPMNMERLKRVGQDMSVRASIFNLPNLEAVRGKLDASMSAIYIPILKEAGSINFHEATIKDMGALERVKGRFAVMSCDFVDCPRLKVKQIDGSAEILNCTNLAGLDELEYIDGTLSVIDELEDNEVRITDFPALREVGRAVYIDRSHIQRLDNLVKSEQFIPPPTFVSAKKLREASTINFRNGGLLTEFPELTTVHGSFLAENVPTLAALPKLKTLDGTFAVGPCKLDEVPELEEVGYKCRMNKTIVRMPKVRRIQGSLEATFDPEKNQPADFEYYFPMVTELNTDPRKWAYYQTGDSREAVISNNPRFIESVKARVASGLLKVKEGEIAYKPDAA